MEQMQGPGATEPGRDQDQGGGAAWALTTAGIFLLLTCSSAVASQSHAVFAILFRADVERERPVLKRTSCLRTGEVPTASTLLSVLAVADGLFGLYGRSEGSKHGA